MTVFWQIPKNRQNRDKGRGIKKGERIMTEKPDYQVGDIVKLKKPHPCGSSEWEILRASDHGGQEDGGEEYQRPEKERRRNVHKPMKKAKKGLAFKQNLW